MATQGGGEIKLAAASISDDLQKLPLDLTAGSLASMRRIQPWFTGR
jgi:hypothetical protein